jgi:hypothetical protein
MGLRAFGPRECGGLGCYQLQTHSFCSTPLEEPRTFNVVKWVKARVLRDGESQFQ